MQRSPKKRRQQTSEVTRFVRIHQEVIADAPILFSTAEIAEAVTHFGLANSVQEELWVMTIDGARHIRAIYAAAKGGYHDCEISLPTLLSPVLLDGCDRFAIAHNHPSGEIKPTDQDLDLTWRLGAAAETVDLVFEDHVIVTPDGGWWSFRGHRQMEPPTRRVKEP